MSRKYFKVGAMYGHVGRGNGLEVNIPILDSDPVHAIKRAQAMGGVKKRFKWFWHAEEIGPLEFLQVREKWNEFKHAMWCRQREKRKSKWAG